MPADRQPYAASGNELEANAWYSRTPYLQRRFPRARPPQEGDTILLIAIGVWTCYSVFFENVLWRPMLQA